VNLHRDHHPVAGLGVFGFGASTFAPATVGWFLHGWGCCGFRRSVREIEHRTACRAGVGGHRFLHESSERYVAQTVRDGAAQFLVAGHVT
jgi:hypothetical protein